MTRLFLRNPDWHAYILKFKISKNDIDVTETIENNVAYPHENEITLKSKYNAKILDIFSLAEL